MRRFLKQTASWSVILVLVSVLAVNFVIHLAKADQKPVLTADGILGGPENQSEPVLADSLSLNVNGESSFNGFAGFILLDSSVILDPGNPLNSVLPTRDNLMIYQIQSGDTVSKIAAKFDISKNSIFWNNPGLISSFIKPGQEIIILPVEGVLHEIKTGDSLDSIAGLYGVSSEDIKKYNPNFQKLLQEPGDKLIIPQGQPLTKNNANTQGTSWAGNFLVDLGNNYFISPTKGWNWGRLHNYNAVDIANSCGTPVYAAADGVVVEVANDNGWNSGYGNYIKIEHVMDKIYTRYAHLDKVLVDNGKYVLQGAEIGLMGKTGNTDGPTGCHLHFEVYGAKNSFGKY
ncbi:MAG: peptidoglycan DD-metalloendopeptidase family protein [bacterium]|nr:peptidoglycan DD-metalloendopeptidase family protein [bacterium]